MVVEGVVIEGRHIGRRIGFPTANIAVDERLPLPDGVYAARVEIDGVRYGAMSNLGCNPSVGGNARRLETSVFGFEGSLYGRRLRVELLERIREERRFGSIEELRRQIESDRQRIGRLLETEFGIRNSK